MLAWILKIIGGKYAIYAGIAAIALVVSGTYLRISYLKKELGQTRIELANSKATSQVYYNANQINYANVQDLSKKLEMCQIDNMVIEAEGRQATKEFKDALIVIEGKVHNDVDRMREILQDKTCASAAIPRSANRLLHDAAGSANGDS